MLAATRSFLYFIALTFAKAAESLSAVAVALALVLGGDAFAAVINRLKRRVQQMLYLPEEWSLQNQSKSRCRRNGQKLHSLPGSCTCPRVVDRLGWKAMGYYMSDFWREEV